MHQSINQSIRLASNPLIYSLIHIYIHLFIQIDSYLVNLRHTHLLAYLLTYSLTHSLTHSLSQPAFQSINHSFTVLRNPGLIVLKKNGSNGEVIRLLENGFFYLTEMKKGGNMDYRF